MTNGNGRREEVALSRSDRARSLEALHALERCAGAAGPKRPAEWRDDVLLALDDLASTLHEQYSHSASETGLLAGVAADAPHLTPAIGEIRQRQSEVLDGIDKMRRRLSDLSRPFDVGEVRSRIGETTNQIRELRAWETDIVFDAYAFDLGTGD